MLEAMAFGIPVLATPVGGIPEIIENNINGYVIEENTSENIANLLEILIENEPLRKNISYNNYHKASKNYLTSHVVSRLEKIYSTLK